MATATKKCKVCGNLYEYCHTNRRVAGIFRWQDVACSPEHGSIYLAKIEASRTVNTVEEKIADEDVHVTEYYLDSDPEDDDDDLWFEEDFDDDTEEPAI